MLRRVRGLPYFVLPALLLPFQDAVAQEAGDEAEPVLEMTLELDGRKTPVRFDEPFYLDAGARRPATLRVAPTRLFARGPIRFRYPREYTFEHSAGNLTTWTLSGNDAKLMVFRYAPALVAGTDAILAATVENIVGRYGRANSRTSDCSLALGARKLAGKRIDATVSGTALRQDLFALRIGGRPWMLILQDAPRGGTATPEAERLKKLLVETFVMTE